MLPPQPSQATPSPSSTVGSSYRQAPYPSPRPSFHVTPIAEGSSERGDVAHRRSNSLAVPHPDVGGNQSGNSNDKRRMSLPLKSEESGTSTTRTQASIPENISTTGTATASAPARPRQKHRPSFDAGTFEKLNATFTMSLPVESQMLLGSGFATSSDPLMASMMAGSSNLPQMEDFGYKPSWAMDDSKVAASDQAPSGLDTTLVPSNLTNNLDGVNWQFSQGFDLLNTKFNASSPTMTPGVNGESWGNFIDTDQWDLSADGSLEPA